MKSLLGIVSLCLLAASADAALVSRLGGQAYYDDVLDITWLADANLAATNTFGVAGIGNTPSDDGMMNWNTAQLFIAAMNDASYLGFNTWRLPHMVDINNDGCVDKFAYNGQDCGYNVITVGPNASEMASLYYQTLGNLAFFDTSGAPQFVFPSIQNTGPFSNLGNTLYWYDLGSYNLGDGSPTSPTQVNAWYFGMPSGAQRPIDKTNFSPMTTWAVLDGDPAAVVPVPAAAWFMGSALGLLGWLRRRH